MNFQQLLDRLYNSTLGGLKLGLENMHRMDLALANPSHKFKSIHIAGTNGKGSVSTKIAKAAELSGLKTGLYTSPHISSFCERIQINSQSISHAKLFKYLKVIFDIVDQENIPATFFEISTILAFYYFAEEKCDLVVIEAGLGGRLDATNIIKPELCVITSIGYDHMDLLGPTIEEITSEKAGIIKDNVAVVIGPQVDLKIIEKFTSQVLQVTGDFTTFNEENNAIAQKAMEQYGFSENVIEGALKAIPPCRMELVDRYSIPIILDVAHNEDGLTYLFKQLKIQYPKHRIRVVFGLSKNKEIDGCLDIILSQADYYYLVSAPNGRGLEVEELEKRCLEKGIKSDKLFVFNDIRTSVDNALKAGIAANDLLLICGTFFIMTSVKKSLGLDVIEDFFDLNEKNIK